MSESTANQPTWYAMPVAEVAAQLKVDPAKGLSAATRPASAAVRPQQLAGQEEGPGMAGISAPVQGLHADSAGWAPVVNQIFTQDLGTTLVLLIG
jgi:hypothetical protein